MRHQKRHFLKLKRKTDHRKMLLCNLCIALFRKGRITTTLTKAKALRMYAEKLVTKAKKNTLHNQRNVFKKLKDWSIVQKLFKFIAPKQLERPGGYTRIYKLGTRKGDVAQIGMLELVEEYVPKNKTSQIESKISTST